MTKSACMICGKEPPFDFVITRDRDREQDPDRKELEIHIKRNHSMEEIQKHANPSEFNKKKKSKADQQEQQEQEGEEAVKTDDVVAELFKKEGSPSSQAGTRSRSTNRGRSSRSRKPTRSTANPMVEESEKVDASSADL